MGAVLGTVGFFITGPVGLIKLHSIILRAWLCYYRAERLVVGFLVEDGWCGVRAMSKDLSLVASMIR